MTPAQRWGRALKATMMAQRIPVKALAASVGSSMSSISQVRAGRYLPSMRQAARYADALSDPDLLSLCAELRTRRCGVCERDFIEDHNGGYVQLWCSDGCQYVGRARLRNGKGRAETRARYDRWKRLAIRRQRAIDAMCHGCEPEGACHQADCALRALSPLPLVGAVAVGPVMAGTVRLSRDDPRRAERSRQRKAAWAREKRARVRAA